MFDTSGDGQGDPESDQMEDSTPEVQSQPSEDGDNPEDVETNSRFPGLTRRGIMKGLGTALAASLVGGSALNYTGETAASESGIPRHRKMKWGLQRVAKQKPDTDVFNNFMINAVSLNLQNITWEEIGNPDSNQTSSDTSTDGSWKLTFRLSNFGIRVSDIDSKNPKLTKSTHRDRGMVEKFRVRTPPQVNSDSSEELHDGDVISISPSMDPDLFGLIDEDKAREEFTEDESDKLKAKPKNVLKSLNNRNSYDTVNISKIKAKIKKDNKLQGIVIDGALIFLGGLSKFAKSIENIVTVADIGYNIFKIGKDAYSIDKINAGIPIYKGFKTKRPSGSRGKVCGGVATFDINITPGEKSYFKVYSKTHYRSDSLGPDNFKDLSSELRWVIEVDAPKADESMPLPRDILSIKYEFSSDDAENGRATWHSDESPNDADETILDNESDPVPGPHPGIWHQKPVTPNESLMVDAYDTKLCTSNIEEYRWSLFRESTDEEEQKCGGSGGTDCKWIELVSGKSTTEPEYEFSGDKIDKSKTEYKIELEAVPENTYENKEDFEPQVSEKSRTTKSTFTTGSVPGAKLIAESNEVLINEEVEFILTKTDKDADVDSWKLELGDGTVKEGDSLKNPENVSDYIKRTHKYEEPDLYTVKLTTKKNGNEYTDTAKVDVNVIQVTADPKKATTGETIDFRAETKKPVEKFKWYFTDDTDTSDVVTYDGDNDMVAHADTQYSDQGEYRVTVEAPAKNSDKLYWDDTNVSIEEPIIVIGGPKTVAKGDTEEYYIKSIKEIKEYNWKSPEGVSGGKRIEYKFEESGKVKIEVEVTTKEGRTVNRSKIVEVKEKDESPVIKEIRGPREFPTNQKAWYIPKIDEDIGLNSYTWLGIAERSDVDNPPGGGEDVKIAPGVAQMSEAGNYEVGLRVTDHEGQNSEKRIDVSVVGEGGVSLSMNTEDPEIDREIEFGAETSGNVEIEKYKWYFAGNNDGPDATTTTPNVTHSYASPGSYTVTVEAEDKNSDETYSDSININIDDGQGPIIAIDGDRSATVGETHTYKVINEGDEGISHYKWDGPKEASGPNKSSIEIEFDSTGTKTVRVEVTGSKSGDKRTDSIDVDVTKSDTPPTINRIKGDTRVPLNGGSVSKNYTVYVEDETPAKDLHYDWTEANEDAGRISDTPFIAKATFYSTGTHTISVEVWDEVNDQKVSESIEVEVYEPNDPPSVSISVSPNNPTTGQDVTFTANANDPDGRIVSYDWSGLVNGSGKSVTKTQIPKGTHEETVKVKDNNGATEKTTVRVTASDPNESPSVSISVSPEKPTTGQDVTFTANASDPDGRIVSYDWSGLVNGSGKSVTKTQIPKGTHEETVKVKDNNGATEKTTVRVTADDPFEESGDSGGDGGESSG